MSLFAGALNTGDVIEMLLVVKLRRFSIPKFPCLVWSKSTRTSRTHEVFLTVIAQLAKWRRVGMRSSSCHPWSPPASHGIDACVCGGTAFDCPSSETPKLAAATYGP